MLYAAGASFFLKNSRTVFQQRGNLEIQSHSLGFIPCAPRRFTGRLNTAT
jgi:hypothetical protein